MGTVRKYAVEHLPTLDYITGLGIALETDTDPVTFEEEARGYLIRLRQKANSGGRGEV